jgi:hypothetical protein
MLWPYVEESHIELLSLSQDVERISHYFFIGDESPHDAQKRANRADALQVKSALAILAEECEQIPALE